MPGVLACALLACAGPQASTAPDSSRTPVNRPQAVPSANPVASANAIAVASANVSPVAIAAASSSALLAAASGAKRVTHAGAAPAVPAGTPGLGIGASLNGRRPFPASNAWNQRVDSMAADPSSATLIASMGSAGHLHPDFGANYDGGPFGIPYIVVRGTQRRVPVSFDYAGESDPGPYPIPASAPIEGGLNSDGDRHVLVLDRDNWRLYELFAAHPSAGGARWTAGSGAVFNLRANTLRPAGWTSADAAGLPIFPGLVRYDEVKAGKIQHALRFTASQTRAGYVAPARHFASSSTSSTLPPMGTRVRLKASFDISGYPRTARIILQAMKDYGMILADNGSNWFISGAPDSRWSDDSLNTLKRVPGNAFEVVKLGKIVTTR